jgi:hypothetical protein
LGDCESFDLSDSAVTELLLADLENPDRDRSPAIAAAAAVDEMPELEKEFSRSKRLLVNRRNANDLG